MISRSYFCPRCHRQVELPAILKQIRAEQPVRVQCGNCQKGAVLVDLKPQEMSVGG